MELSLDAFNTVESRIVLHDQEVLCQLRKEAQRALDHVMAGDLACASMHSVVTRHKPGRTFLCMKRTRVHTHDMATWPIPWYRRIVEPLLLCSDGNLYVRMLHRNFWHHGVYHMMPIEFADRMMQQEALEAVKRFNVPGATGITGFPV